MCELISVRADFCAGEFWPHSHACRHVRPEFWGPGALFSSWSDRFTSKGEVLLRAHACMCAADFWLLFWPQAVTCPNASHLGRLWLIFCHEQHRITAFGCGHMQLIIFITDQLCVRFSRKSGQESHLLSGDGYSQDIFCPGGEGDLPFPDLPIRNRSCTWPRTFGSGYELQFTAASLLYNIARVRVCACKSVRVHEHTYARMRVKENQNQPFCDLLTCL